VRDEVDDAAEHVRAVLRAVRPAQNLDRLKARRLDEAEECTDAAALRARRVAHAVHVDGDVAARQAAHEDGAQARARALKVDAVLLVHDLRDDLGRARDDLLFGDDVDRLGRAARVGDLPGLGRHRDLLGERLDFERVRGAW
jgi:hypothetical protein